MPNEASEVCAILRALKLAGACAFHVPNESKERRANVTAGVCDIVVMDSPPRAPHFKGLAIELKVNGNSATDEQRRFLRAAEARGFYSAVIEGSVTALRCLRTLGFDV